MRRNKRRRRYRRGARNSGSAVLLDRAAGADSATHPQVSKMPKRKVRPGDYIARWSRYLRSDAMRRIEAEFEPLKGILLLGKAYPYDP